MKRKLRFPPAPISTNRTEETTQLGKQGMPIPRKDSPKPCKITRRESRSTEPRVYNCGSYRITA